MEINMSVVRKNIQHNFSNGMDSYDHVTNNIDYEFIVLYEGDYVVAELEVSDVIAMCKALNITGDDLTA